MAKRNDYRSRLLSWYAGSKNEIYVDSYQAKLLSKKPVEQIAGYVRSNRTNQRAPLLTDKQGKLVNLDQIEGIPPNVPISIHAMFKVDGVDRLRVGDFLEHWGDFSVHINLDGEGYDKRYSLKNAYKLVRQFRQQNEDPRLRLK